MTVVNVRQAQIERSMNVNMAAQTILTKLPKKIDLPPSQNSNNSSTLIDLNEHKIYFNGIFDMVKHISIWLKLFK